MWSTGLWTHFRRFTANAWMCWAYFCSRINKHTRRAARTYDRRWSPFRAV